MKRRGRRHDGPRRVQRGGLLLLGAPVLIAVVLVCGLWISGRLREDRVAAIIIVTYAAMISCYLLAREYRSAGPRRPRIIGGVAVVVGSVVATFLALIAIFPGHPVADRIVRKSGDTIKLPPSVHRAKLLVSAAPMNDGVVTVEMTGGETAIHVRLGSSRHRTVHGKAVHSRDGTASTYVTVRIPDGVSELIVTKLGGATPLAVRIAVFRAGLGHRWLLTCYALVLVFAAIAATWGGRGRVLVMGVGAMVVYSINIRASATPQAALLPALVGLLPSIVVGAIIGALAHAIVRAAIRLGGRGGNAT